MRILLLYGPERNQESISNIFPTQNHEYFFLYRGKNNCLTIGMFSLSTERNIPCFGILYIYELHSNLSIIGTATKYVYMKTTTVYVPSSELGLSQPLSRKECSPPPRTRGGLSPAGEGLGESQLQRLEKKS
jgi:hypothetical protein